MSNNKNGHLRNLTEEKSYPNCLCYGCCPLFSFVAAAVVAAAVVLAAVVVVVAVAVAYSRC